jgi:hypothetical protein
MSFFRKPSRATFFLALAIALVLAYTFRIYQDYQAHSSISDMRKLFMFSSLVNLISAASNYQRSRLEERNAA